MVDWSEYLSEFHTERPGVADRVLRRSTAGHHNPYHWLARGVSRQAHLVLDVACGSGAMGRELALDGRTVVGVDLSAAEVHLAAASGPGPWVQADARALPFADGVFDAVVSTLGLAVVDPTGALLDEVCRVLRPGGLFVGLVPTVRPLNASDMRIAGTLTRLLRSAPQFPVQVELGVGQLLADHGLRKVEDARERYRYPVRSREDAELLVSSFYLPRTPPERLEQVVRWMAAQAARDGQLDVPMPLRRIAAIK